MKPAERPQGAARRVPERHGGHLGRFAPDEAIAFGSRPSMPYQSRLEPLCQDIAKWKQEGRLRGAAHRRRGARTQAANRARGGMCPPPTAPHWTATSSRASAAAAGILYQGVCEPARGAVRSAIPISTAPLPTRPQKKQTAGERIASLTDLKAGDYVVHDLHGVGLFKGVVQLENDGARRDYLLIQYAGNDKLYVPADQFDQGDQVHRLRKRRPQAQPPGRPGMGTAEEQGSSPASKSWPSTWPSSTPDAQARRGYAFSHDNPWQREFEDLFPTS